MEGKINVTADGWFNLSVPYAEGFEILVDGVETQYYKTNTAFIGFPVERGEHYIIINYNAPCRNIGLMMTICGLGASICMLVYVHVNGRKYALNARKIQVSSQRKYAYSEPAYTERIYFNE